MSGDKQYIMKKCQEFSKEQNLLVLKFLTDMSVKISENADGCRINLDKL